ncbi:MAG: hypothetical protein J5I94_20520 [Phaeodactylibacter sp.]|nr:hypothetical protein [Phaeodactylibacter sp.]
MRMIAAGILSILLLNLGQAPCLEQELCDAREETALVQNAEAVEDGHHCCPGDHSEEKEDEPCPPTCHCACCHSPAVSPPDKYHLFAFTPEAVKPGLISRLIPFDFQHLIWHPPQAG